MGGSVLDPISCREGHAIAKRIHNKLTNPGGSKTDPTRTLNGPCRHPNGSQTHFAGWLRTDPKRTLSKLRAFRNLF